LVPTSQREWTQFLGRTARQDRRGQFCAVLCNSDYESLTKRYNEALPNTGGLEVVRAVLGWGDRLVADKIKGSSALYNTGLRMNELCEEIFARLPQVLADPVARERLVDICQRYRWMAVREVNEAFARVPGMETGRVMTEAKDMGRPAEPPAAGRMTGSVVMGNFPQPGSVLIPTGSRTSPAPSNVAVPAGPKVVIFCLDWSASMMSRDTGTNLNRFELCSKHVQRILMEQVSENDLVGVVCFGPRVDVICPPTPKSAGGPMLMHKIQALKPSMQGGTCFFDAVAQCLQMMQRPVGLPPDAARWLVCLTDGDDLGSRADNQQGQQVTRMLNLSSLVARLNMMMITVGMLKANNLKIIDSWCERVSMAGGLGKLVAEKNAKDISKAFEVVYECLASEVGGATEC